MTLHTPHVPRAIKPTPLDLDPEFLRVEALRRTFLADQVSEATLQGEPWYHGGRMLTAGAQVDHARHLRETALVYARLAAQPSPYLTSGGVVFLVVLVVAGIVAAAFA